MTKEHLTRKVNNLIGYYERNGFSVVGEPHTSECKGLYSMCTYTLVSGKTRVYLVATLWATDNDWTISAYNPARRGKPIFTCGGKEGR